MPEVSLLDRNITYSIQEKVNARTHAEFFEQGGDVKLHCALGEMQPCSDLLVAEVLRYAIEDFALPVT